MMGFILNILTTLLNIIFVPFLYAYSWYKTIGIRDWNKHNFNLAVSKDQLGNVRGKYLFNDILITKDGYSFGNVDETISSVIGKNKRKKTLTLLGRTLDFILDKIDPNHSIKSIEEDENND